MQNLLHAKSNALRPLSINLLLICSTLYIAAAAYFDAAAFYIPIVLFACYAAIYLPGAVLRRLCGIGGNASVCSSIVLGSAAFAISTALAALTSFYFLPLLVTIALLIFGAIRYKNSLSIPKLSHSLCITFSLLIIALIFIVIMPFAHPSQGRSIVPSQDFYWVLGNAQGFLHSMPPPDLRFSGVTLTYHYLTELIAAGLHMVTGAPLHEILAYCIPIIVAFAILLAAKECITCVFQKSSARNLVFLSSFFLLGCSGLVRILEHGASPFGNTLTLHILSNLNSVGTCVLFLCCFCAIMAQLVRGGFKSAALFIACLAALSLITLSKGPIAAIVIVALLCSALFRTRREGARLKYLIFCVSCITIFAAFYFMLFANGASSSIAFSADGTILLFYFKNIASHLKQALPSVYPFTLPFFYVVHAFLMSPFIMLFFIIATVQQIFQFFKRRSDSIRLFFMFAGWGGMLAFFISDLGGLSQMYFAFAGLFFAALLASDCAAKFVVKIKESPTIFRKICFVLAAIILCASISSGVFNYVIVVRNAFNTFDVVDSLKFPLTKNIEAGLLHLKSISKKTDVFATNRMHSTIALENNSNLFTGISGRASFGEGMSFSIANMNAEISTVALRRAIIKDLFSNAMTPESAAAIAKMNGISYLVYDKTVIEHDCNEGAAQNNFYLKSSIAVAPLINVFENDDIAIFKVN